MKRKGMFDTKLLGRLRRALDTEFSKPIAVINTDHPDYQERFVAGDFDSKLEYVTRMVAEPMAIWESKKAEEEAGVKFENERDRMVKVQQRVNDLVYFVTSGGKKERRKEEKKKEINLVFCLAE